MKVALLRVDFVAPLPSHFVAARYKVGGIMKSLFCKISEHSLDEPVQIGYAFQRAGSNMLGLSPEIQRVADGRKGPSLSNAVMRNYLLLGCDE